LEWNKASDLDLVERLADARVVVAWKAGTLRRLDKSFAQRVRFAGGGFNSDDPGSLLDVLKQARAALGSDPQLVHYLAVPPVAFAELTQGLGQHGLARVEPGSLQLHRLLQAILRAQPSEHDMATVAIRLLRATVPADSPWDNPPTWPLWRQLLPHVLVATDVRHTPDPTGDDVGWLLEHAGIYVLTRGEPASARPLYERSLSLRRSALGEDHPDTLSSADNLAVNLHELG